MPSDVGGNERTTRDDTGSERPDVIERSFDEPRPDAPPFERCRHLGVTERPYRRRCDDVDERHVGMPLDTRFEPLTLGAVRDRHLWRGRQFASPMWRLRRFAITDIT